MQDNYIGDIGDYGKYGLLRIIRSENISLAINWYKVTPPKTSKQDDGKYTNYLLLPNLYKSYDPNLFDALFKIVYQQNNRKIA